LEQIKIEKAIRINLSWFSCGLSFLVKLEFRDAGFVEVEKAENREKTPGARREPTTN